MEQSGDYVFPAWYAQMTMQCNMLISGLAPTSSEDTDSDDSFFNNNNNKTLCS